MTDKIIGKIRALIKPQDLGQTHTEPFEYKNSKIFTLAETKKIAIIEVTINDSPLPSGADYTYDSTDSTITLDASLSSGDIVKVKYTYYQYSDEELKEYIRASLVYISVYGNCPDDYELEGDEIFPTPENKTTDLIALISAIQINPNYSEYRLPNITVRYPKTMEIDEKIQKLIYKFSYSLGVNDVIEIE